MAITIKDLKKNYSDGLQKLKEPYREVFGTTKPMEPRKELAVFNSPPRNFFSGGRPPRFI